MIGRIETLARQQNFDEIENFVSERIEFLLAKLYQDLKKCEDMVSNCCNQANPASVELLFASRETSDVTPAACSEDKFPCFFVQGKIVESKTLFHWMRHLYFRPGGGSRGYVVGPEGERPLHVFFLRAYALTASGKDLQIRNGMLKGIKSYIEKQNPEEVSISYGKDYCAAVGSIVADSPSNIETLWEGSFPPLYNYLKNWAKSTYYNSQLKQHREIEHDSRMLVSAGLYEGETVLYFAIMGMDVCTVDWLLGRGLKYAHLFL